MQILEILHYVAKIQNTNQLKNNNKNSKEVDEAIEKLISGVFTNYNNIKSKKYSDLRKYSEILCNLMETSSKKSNIKEKLIIAINGWE